MDCCQYHIGCFNYRSSPWVINFSVFCTTCVLLYIFLVVLYDFTIWVTAISLVLTVSLWGLTKKAHSQLPPHLLAILSGVLNRWFPYSVGTQKNEKTGIEEPAAEDPESPSVSTSFGSSCKIDVDYEWREGLRAVNNLLLILFAVIYLLGLIIICAS